MRTGRSGRTLGTGRSGRSGRTRGTGRSGRAFASGQENRGGECDHDTHPRIPMPPRRSRGWLDAETTGEPQPVTPATLPGRYLAGPGLPEKDARGSVILPSAAGKHIRYPRPSHTPSREKSAARDRHRDDAHCSDLRHGFKRETCFALAWTKGPRGLAGARTSSLLPWDWHRGGAAVPAGAFPSVAPRVGKRLGEPLMTSL